MDIWGGWLNKLVAYACVCVCVCGVSSNYTEYGTTIVIGTPLVLSRAAPSLAMRDTARTTARAAVSHRTDAFGVAWHFFGSEG